MRGEAVDETQRLLHRPASRSTIPADSPESTDQQAQHTSTRTWRAKDSPKVAAAMYCFFATGISMTAIGALLGDIETYYHLSDTRAGSIFPTAVTGYILAALTVPRATSRSGWRALATISPICHATSSVMLGLGPRLPVTLVAYFVGGVAAGFNDPGFNSWASKLPFPNVVQGLLHGSFSVGCIVGPILALAAKKFGEWYIFYRILAGVSLVECIVLGLAFRHDGVEQLQKLDAHARDVTPDGESVSSARTVRLVVACSIFYFCYIAIESSFTNWIVLYMNRVRHADTATATLASSVYWIGMGSGRVGLGPVTELVGLTRAVILYITCSVLLQCLFVMSTGLATSMVILALNGVFLGPMFPSGVNLLGCKLPIRAAITAISLAASAGQVAGAMIPLGIGAMSERIGLQYLPLLMLSFTAILLILWLVLVRCG